MNRRKLLGFTGLICLLLAIVAAAGCSKSRSENSGEELLEVLNADLSFTLSHLIVTNGNDYVWREATVTLNGTYKQRLPLLPRGGSSLPLNEFVDSRGRSFNPDSQTVRKVTITVPDTLNGIPGSFSW